MAGSEDPRLDRVIATVNTLESAQAQQAETISQLRADLAAAHRDASDAREAAALAKSETAAYQAEVAALARRADVERLEDRLVTAEASLDEFRQGDTQAGALRDHVVKLGKALGNTAASADVTELAQRVEQIDDRLQARMNQVASDVVTATTAATELQSSIASVSSDAGDLGQSLDRRIQAIEEAGVALTSRFDEMVRTAEDEMERVAGNFEQRVGLLEERVESTAVTVARLDDSEITLSTLATQLADLQRSVTVLRSSTDSDRTVTRELEQRVFGVDGVGPRLLQLAQVVVDRDGRNSLQSSVDTALLEFQNRLEDLTSRVESLGTLRTRLEVVERRVDR